MSQIKTRFCPECGLKLLNLAEGYGTVVPGIRQLLVYFVCGSCKDLLVAYDAKAEGYHFKLLGKITDESLAMIIADSLKGETS